MKKTSCLSGGLNVIKWWTRETWTFDPKSQRLKHLLKCLKNVELCLFETGSKHYKNFIMSHPSFINDYVSDYIAHKTYEISLSLRRELFLLRQTFTFAYSIRLYLCIWTAPIQKTVCVCQLKMRVNEWPLSVPQKWIFDVMNFVWYLWINLFILIQMYLMHIWVLT